MFSSAEPSVPADACPELSPAGKMPKAAFGSSSGILQAGQGASRAVQNLNELPRDHTRGGPTRYWATREAVVSSERTGMKAALGVRTIRLLRLVKLARVLKAARVFTSLITDLLVKYFDITYAVTEIMKLIFMIISIAHLSACMWSFLPSVFIDDESPTWKRAMREDKGQDFDSPLELYVAALYWATMTLTGIGYGDISAQNTPDTRSTW